MEPIYGPVAICPTWRNNTNGKEVTAWLFYIYIFSLLSVISIKNFNASMHFFRHQCAPSICFICQIFKPIVTYQSQSLSSDKHPSSYTQIIQILCFARLLFIVLRDQMMGHKTWGQTGFLNRHKPCVLWVVPAFHHSCNVALDYVLCLEGDRLLFSWCLPHF